MEEGHYKTQTGLEKNTFCTYKQKWLYLGLFNPSHNQNESVLLGNDLEKLSGVWSSKGEWKGWATNDIGFSVEVSACWRAGTNPQK